jgi:hypothetical protein
MILRERLMAVFEKREPDIIPFVPDLTYYFNTAVAQGKIPVDPEPLPMEKALVDFHIANFSIPYYIYGQGVFDFKYEGVEIITRKENQRVITEYHVGSRVIREVKEYNEVSYSWAPVQYPVETKEDLETLLEILVRAKAVPNVPRWVEVNERIGDLGVPACIAPRSPLPALVVDWAGVENSIFLMADEPDLFGRVLSAIDLMNDEPFRIITQSPARLIHFADNLTGLTFAGWWDKYLAEYYTRRVSELHAAGKYCASHLDGTLSGMIGRMARTGLDAIESITPAPVGDMALEEVDRELEGFDTIMWGGVPGAMFAKPFTWPQVKAQVDTMLKLHQKGRRIIIASADQVPPDGDIGLVRQIGEYLLSGN